MALSQRRAAAKVPGYELLSDKDPSGLGMNPPSVSANRDVARSVPAARLLRLSDLPKVAKDSSTILALTDDPMDRYLLGSPEEAVRLRKLITIERGLGISLPVRRKMAWAIDDGDAFMGYSDPMAPQSKLSQFIDKITIFIIEQRTRFHSEEQKKRLKELQTKLRKVIPDALGDRRNIMLCLDYVSTVPEKRSRGYGTALVKILTTKADIENRPTWLTSSDVATNTGFYNNLGFPTVAEVTLGDDNPTWKEPPVQVAIMVREPQPWK